MSVFVKNQTGNLNVADFTVKCGGFAKNVNTFDVADILHNFSEDVIGGKTKRVINIKDESWRFLETGGFGDFKPRVKMGRGNKVFYRKNLDGDIKILPVGNGNNTKLALSCPIGSLIFGLMKEIAGSVVEKIGGVEAGGLLLDVLPLLIETGMVTMNKIDYLGLVSSGEAGNGINQTMSVAGDKINFLTGNVK